MNKRVRFACGEKVLEILFEENMAQEIKAGDPVIRRIVFHETHAHLVRIDAQGGDRGNDNLELYKNAGNPAIEGGIKVEYICEECQKSFSFFTKKYNMDKGPIKDDLGIPLIQKGYTCVHLHGDETSPHAIQVRLTPQGKLQFAKFIKIAKIL